MKTSSPLIRFCGLGCFLFAPAFLNAQQPPADSNAAGQLPLRKVVLYKHGVGYFERRGLVADQQAVTLRFQSEQMNDLLKSLTAIDLGGGQVASIVYDSTKTVDQLLSDYTFTLRKNAGLPEILGQLQGSDVEIALGSETVTGVIVGVETRLTQSDDTKIPTFRLSVMDTAGRLRAFNTDEIRSVRFLDERLNRDLQRYMQILFQQHRRDEKNVVIRPAEKGARQLLVSYVTETPVWKATYRIVLPDKDKQESLGKPFLQGWAIVDNVSTNDWDNVQLSLVSGLPISFVQDLYNPWFKKRPIIAVEEEIALAPTVPEEGMTAGAAGGMPALPAAPAPALARSAKKSSRAVGARDQKEKLELRTDEMGSLGGAPAQEVAFNAPLDLENKMRELQAQTVTREVGDLFEYKIDHPVSIARNRSALLPIVAQDTDGQAVSLYNESVRAANPLAAVRLKNTTGLTLEGGPLTVMQGDTYVGEALIKTVKPDEQRYITYAVDLGLHVNTKIGSKSERVDHVIINRGLMRHHNAVIETKVYNLDNKTDRDETVVVEHPFQPDWKLLNEQKPLEITDNFYRFEVNTPAGKLTAFEVRTQRDNWETLSLTDLTPDFLALCIREKRITDDVRKQLEQILAVKAEIVALDRQLAELEQERNTIVQDQTRLRENVRSLGQTEEEKRLRSRYIAQLTAQETRLDEITNSVKSLQQKRQEKQQQLDKLIESLSQDLKL
jgi:hypothetical protein